MDFIDKTDGDYLENGKDLRGTAMERAYLLNLIRDIAAVDGIERIRLGSLEPRIITEEFAGGLAALPKVLSLIHIWWRKRIRTSWSFILILVRPSGRGCMRQHSFASGS